MIFKILMAMQENIKIWGIKYENTKFFGVDMGQNANKLYQTTNIIHTLYFYSFSKIIIQLRNSRYSTYKEFITRFWLDCGKNEFDVTQIALKFLTYVIITLSTSPVHSPVPISI